MEPIRAKDINEDDRDLVMRVLAKVFMQKGGGQPVWRQAIKSELKRDIVSSSLNNFMTSVMKHTYSQLQDFVSKQTDKKIKALGYTQIQSIRIPMIKCKEWMAPSMLTTFYKFISISILHQKEQVSKEEACLLFQKLRYLYSNFKEKQKLLKQCKTKTKIDEIRKGIGLKQTKKDRGYSGPKGGCNQK